MDINDLVLRYKSGDQGAFAALHKECNGVIELIVRRYTTDSATILDYQQDIWLKIIERLGMYEVGSFKSWVGVIARNYCVDVYRKQKSRVKIEYFECYPEDIPDPYEASKDDLMNTLIIEMEKIIDADGHKRSHVIGRDVVFLHAMGYLNKDIAGIVEVPHNTINTWTSKLLDRVRHNLTGAPFRHQFNRKQQQLGLL